MIDLRHDAICRVVYDGQDYSYNPLTRKIEPVEPHNLRCLHKINNTKQKLLYARMKTLQMMRKLAL